MLYKVKDMGLVTVDTETPVYLKWLNIGASQSSRVYPDKSEWYSDISDGWINPYPLIETPKRLTIETLKQQGVGGVGLHSLSPRMVVTNDKVDVNKVNKIYGKFGEWCNDIGMPFGVNVCSPWVSSKPAKIHYNMPDLMWREAGYSDSWVPDSTLDEFNEIQKDINWKFFSGRLPDTKELYLTIFEEMARAVGNKDYFGYIAPWNEPAHMTWKQQTEQEAKDIGVGYRDFTENAIDRIRVATGEETLVMWDKEYLGYNGTGKNYDSQGNLMHKKVRRSNVVYEVHKYYSKSNNYNIITMTNQFKVNYDFAVDWGISVYLGEWGINNIENMDKIRPMETGFRPVLDAWRDTGKFPYLVGDELFCLGRLYDQYQWTWENHDAYKWYDENETKWVLDNVFNDDPNGGNAMSVKYTNETSEDQIAYKRKTVVQDTEISPVPSGATIVFSLANDEELVTKDS